MADLVGRIEAGAELKASVEPNKLQINVSIVGSGPAGRAGYTPVKGVDYRDGVDGRDGAPGKDGYTPQKGVDYFDGATGEKGDPFTYDDFTQDQLEALRGPEGQPGQSGPPGEKGESGVYYGAEVPGDGFDVWIDPSGSGDPNTGGVQFTTDETLTLKDGVLSVNTAQEPDPDNTLPITSAAVYTTVGNIEVLLQTI